MPEVFYDIAWFIFKKATLPLLQPSEQSGNAFRERREELVKEEYQLVSRCEDRKDMVEIRHRTCGTITKMKAENFLYGTRHHSTQESR